MEHLEEDPFQGIKSLGVPGFSVAVVKEDQTRWMKGFGLADIVQETPATPETVYMWFSLTKIVTATAIMQLVDQRKLSLDDKVSEYIPNFPMAKKSEPPRVRHLLNHSSGLPNPMPIRWVHVATDKGPDPDIFLNYLLTKHRTLKSSPGQKASYSNIGYLALGKIVAASSGMPYKDYVVSKVLKPIGMQQTDFYYTADMLEKAATGYQKRLSAMSLLWPLLHMPRGVLGRRAGDYIAFNKFYLDGSAYGGLIGSVNDAARFVQVHVNGGMIGGVRIISQESVAMMQRISSQGKALDVGYSWFRMHSSLEQIPYLQQIGGGAGFLSIMRIYPEESLGVVVMGNSTSYDMEQIIEKVRRAAGQ